MSAVIEKYVLVLGAASPLTAIASMRSDPRSSAPVIGLSAGRSGTGFWMPNIELLQIH